MKRIRVLLFILIMIVNVKADNCSNDELKRLKDLANQVEINFDYEIKKEGEEVDYNFKLVASNLNKELKVIIPQDYYLMKNIEFRYNDSKKATINDFNSGDNITVEIRAYSDNECAGKLLLTKKIKIPYYNSMYGSEECNGYEDFIYCKNEITEKEVTFDEFFNKLEDYKNSLKKSNDSNIIDIEVDNNNTLKKVIIIGIFLIGVIFLSILYSKKFIKRKKEMDI